MERVHYCWATVGTPYLHHLTAKVPSVVKMKSYLLFRQILGSLRGQEGKRLLMSFGEVQKSLFSPAWWKCQLPHAEPLKASNWLSGASKTNFCLLFLLSESKKGRIGASGSKMRYDTTTSVWKEADLRSQEISNKKQYSFLSEDITASLNLENEFQRLPELQTSHCGWSGTERGCQFWLGTQALNSSQSSTAWHEDPGV